MAKFKVGDRVRINCPESQVGNHGKTGTIWEIVADGQWFGAAQKNNGLTDYRVDVDGKGKYGPLNLSFGYPEHELEPLIPPDELAWQQFKTYLQPNPAILPPIVTTSDEEAARIAETTPGSHIHVVSRSGNVLSEYWGKPW